MARIRTVKPELFTDAKVAALSVAARLFFIGLFCHADRNGRFEWKPEDLRMRVMPLDKISVTVRAMEELEGVGLIVNYGPYLEYGWIPNFEKHQVFNVKEQKSRLPEPPEKKHCANTVQALDGREGKGRERKGREREGKLENSLSYLQNIPEEDMQMFISRFDASRVGVKSKAEDLLLYCKSKHKTYSDYRAFLLNALKKDFPERKISQKPTQNEPVEIVDRVKVQEQLQKTREMLSGRASMGIGEEKNEKVEQ